MASSIVPDPHATTYDMVRPSEPMSLPQAVPGETLARIDIEAEFEQMDRNIRGYDEAMARVRERRGIYRWFRTSV